MMLRYFAFVLFTSAFSIPVYSQSHVPDGVDLTYEPTHWAGYNDHNIYLSTARHFNTTKRGECLNASENYMSFVAAIFTAAVSHGKGNSLRKRGYRVRIGRAAPREASTRSDNFNADAHIAIHSNGNQGQINCSSSNPTNFAPGTKVAFFSLGNDAGEELAEKLRSQVGNESPGNSDSKACMRSGSFANSSCPCPNSFGGSGIPISCNLRELWDPSATAAYLETEFHTWNNGVDFINDPYRYNYRIAEAIDSFYDYERNTP